MRKWLIWLTTFSIALIAFSAISAQETGSGLVGTNWELVSFNTPNGETPALSVTTVTLAFEDETQAGGNGGCNGYGSAYQVDGDAISFEGVISTMMACMDGDVTPQENAYFDALNTATRYEIDGDTLTIWYGENGENWLTFTAVVDAPLVGTTWELVSIGTPEAITSVIGDAQVSLTLDDMGHISGNGGCNGFGGSYSVNGDAIAFTEVIHTEMACLDPDAMQQESDYFAALNAATRYEIEGGALTIYSGEDDATTLNFVAAREETLVGTQWQLVSFLDYTSGRIETPVVEGSGVIIEFGEEGAVAGNAGCNTFNGSYELQGELLSFGPLATTRRACADAALSEQEAAFLSALGLVQSYGISQGGSLSLFYDGGMYGLHFARLQTMPDSA